jgi:DNA-nicking Smr family endonuclease
MNTGIIDLNIHGMTKYQAQISIESQLKKAKPDVYRIRVIHGYHDGTELKNMVRSVYRSHPKVIRIEIGMNEGITDLILRELYS